MKSKHCLIYETLGKVSDLKVSESKDDGLVRLSGVFGVCGIRNNNNRIYDKGNYSKMVESLQKIIKTEGVPGELEHPNTMNINLERVSHKIESIEMNEDGTITGTIALLDTPQGRIAKAIIEGGLPLYISSRAAGTMTNESGINHVTLSSIKTYDLVGTPGFSQAKMTLKENQTLECLNESADDGNIMYAIVESDDLLGDDSDKEEKKSDEKDSDKEEKKSDEKDSDKEEKKSDEKDSDDKDDEKDSDEEEKSSKDKEEKNKKNNDNVNMKDLKEAIDKLTDKVTSLEAQLHVAQESLDDQKPVNYDAIQEWITDEFAPNFKNQIMESIGDIDKQTDFDEALIDDKINESLSSICEGIQNWVVNEFAPEVQNWVCEEFAPEVQNWICEEFAPEVQNWITEEYSPEVQNWITEEYSPEVQNWITEEFAPVLEGWITEEFGPQQMESVNEHVNSFIESQKSTRLDEIDSLLESISQDKNSDVQKIIEETENLNKWKGVYVVENMPAEYKPSWETLTEERQNEIIRSSRMYDFTKNGVLENFWANINFEQSKSNAQLVNESQIDPMTNYQMNIVNKMKQLRRVC